MIKRRVSRKEYEQNKYLVWNAFIDLVAMEEENDLTKIQKNGKRVFVYDSEIQNGGHMQYFENNRFDDYSPIIESLYEMNATKQAELLNRAVDLFKGKERPIIEDKHQYCSIALEGEFDEMDGEYYSIFPTLTELMEQYLSDNTNEFIDFIE